MNAWIKRSDVAAISVPDSLRSGFSTRAAMTLICRDSVYGVIVKVNFSLKSAWRMSPGFDFDPGSGCLATDV